MRIANRRAGRWFRLSEGRQLQPNSSDSAIDFGEPSVVGILNLRYEARPFVVGSIVQVILPFADEDGAKRDCEVGEFDRRPLEMRAEHAAVGMSGPLFGRPDEDDIVAFEERRTRFGKVPRAGGVLPESFLLRTTSWRGTDRVPSDGFQGDSASGLAFKRLGIATES